MKSGTSPTSEPSENPTDNGTARPPAHQRPNGQLQPRTSAHQPAMTTTFASPSTAFHASSHSRDIDLQQRLPPISAIFDQSHEAFRSTQRRDSLLHSKPTSPVRTSTYAATEHYTFVPPTSIYTGLARQHDHLTARATRLHDEPARQLQSVPAPGHLTSTRPAHVPRVPSITDNPTKHQLPGQTGSPHSPVVQASPGSAGDRSPPASSSRSGHPSDRNPWATGDVPRNGLCHVRGDSRQQPVEGGGQRVSPDMGVTKQNKPRKRQSHACLFCREKKTKCEIDRNRNGPCLACAKANRECKWSTGFPPIQGPTIISEASGVMTGKRRQTSEEDESAPRRTSDNPTYKHTPSNSMSGKTEGRPAKRVKSPSLGFPPTPQSLLMGLNNAPARPSHTPSDSNGPHWLDLGVTRRLLVYYFRHWDPSCTQTLPHAAFMNWVDSPSHKSQDELMMLHTCLAVASIYCVEPELKDAGRSSLELAEKMEATRYGDFTLPLAQTRLHLAICHWASGATHKALDYIASGCRALGVLHYNTEQGCMDQVSKEPLRNSYHFSDVQLIECRRRTFWLGYLTERYTGHYMGNCGILADEDIGLRVPNHEADFEAGHGSIGPYFDDGTFSTLDCGEMALFVGIVSIWGLVTKEVLRTTHRPRADYHHHYEAHYAALSRRLEQWYSKLPPRMRNEPGNTIGSLENDTFTQYYVLHAAYHLTLMKLNQYCRVDLLPVSSIRRNIMCAREAAGSFLNIITTVSRLEPGVWEGERISRALLQPFSGSALTAACDILSCGGPRGDLDLVYRAIGCAGEIANVVARHYKSGAQQQQIFRGRQAEFGAHMQTRGDRPWRFKQSMEKGFTTIGMNVIYGTSDEMYDSCLARPFS